MKISKISASVILSILLIIGAIFSKYKDKVATTLSYVNNDSLQGLTSKIPSSDPNQVMPVNETELLGRELFTQYMTVRQSGKLNSTTTQSIVNNLTSKVGENPAPVYSDKDLNIIQKATNDDLKKYANKFWEIRERYKNQYVKSTSAGGGGLVSTSADSVQIKNLISAGILYVDMARELSELPVPQEIANLHLQIINNEQASGESLKKLSQLSTDPFVSVAGLSVYSKYSDYEDTLLKVMAGYLSESGIIFSDKEPGAGWKTL